MDDRITYTQSHKLSYKKEDDMKKILLATAAVIGMAIPAAAETIIAVGQEGRGYEAFGKKMVERLNGKLPASIENYEG